MRRLIALLAVAALAACGGDDETASEATTSTVAEVTATTSATSTTQTTLTVEDAWARMWNELDQASRDEMCGGMVLFGPENAGEKISEGSGGRITPAQATDLLQESCLDV